MFVHFLMKVDFFFYELLKSYHKFYHSHLGEEYATLLELIFFVQEQAR